MIRFTLRWPRLRALIGRRSRPAGNGTPAAPPPAPSAMPLPDAAACPRAAGKQAVVLVHGMGEQIPMDTIRGFVRAGWELDTVVTANGLPNPAKTWSKPDDRTGSLELRRITTRESIPVRDEPLGVRSDFYELYWADLTAGSTWSQFVNWVRYLLLRRHVPRDVRLAWVTLWILSLLAVAIGLLVFVPEAVWTAHAPFWLPQKSVLAIFAAVGAFVHNLATRSFGRVVRYTRAEPDNIAARANVRARGLALLRALHADDSYERIVVVGHSLGTILAYDLVSYFWAERAASRTVAEGREDFAALCDVELRAAQVEIDDGAATRAAYRTAQTRLRRALAARDDPGSRWLISDLVTFGSPLSHAEFLLASGKQDLELRQQARELPTSPPYREKLDPPVLDAARAAGILPADGGDDTHRLISFPEHRGNRRWTLHHAAPFAAVRWTNVFDRSRLLIFGDMISGPMQPSFGNAIDDIDLAQVDRPSRRFTHTRYWALDQSAPRLDAFRAAINLLDADIPRAGATYGRAPAAGTRYPPDP